MLIIGLTGPAGSGKSTIAKFLVNHENFCELSFAAPLYDMVAAMLAMSRENLVGMLENRDVKDQPMKQLCDRSPRHVLQTLGTEWGRNLIHPDIWVHAVRNRLAWIEETLSHEFVGVVISDVRFPNEAEFVRNHGSLVHVRNDGSPHVAKINVREHISESGIAPEYGEFVIANTQTVDFLHQQVTQAVDQLLRRPAA
jgi:cytidylate kinase